MTPIKATDTAGLNAAMAEKVAGWRVERFMSISTPPTGAGLPPGWRAGDPPQPIPDFCHSADSVLPFLEKSGWRGTSNRAGSTCAATVEVNHPECDGRTFIAQISDLQSQTPFPHAAVIALLRSRGVEVVE